MKIKHLGEFIVFDEFPTKYIPKQRIVLTHLLHLEDYILPPRLPQIITSKYLAKKLREYFRQKGARCYNTLDIMELETNYTFTDIMLPGYKLVQMILYESKEMTRNLMAVIKHAGQLTIYAANFLDVRTIFLNENFVTWFEGKTVQHLYLNLKRYQENPEKQDVDIMDKVFDIVKKILASHSSKIVHMYLPQFGYDHFIYNLACSFPKRITISSDFKSSINPIIENKTLSFSSELLAKAKIILMPGMPPESNVAICAYTKREKVVLHIQEKHIDLDKFDVDPKANLYTLYYTPEPSPFQLQLLCLVFKPKLIHGIIGIFNNISTVPKYLNDVFGNTTAVPVAKRRKLSSGRALTYCPQRQNQDDIYLDSSSSD